MSEYGPAVFISRVDGSAIAELEQQSLLVLLSKCVTTLKILDPADDSPSEPEFYDY